MNKHRIWRAVGVVVSIFNWFENIPMRVSRSLHRLADRIYKPEQKELTPVPLRLVK